MKQIALLIFSLIYLNNSTFSQNVIRNLGFEDLDASGRLISWEISNPQNSYKIQIDTSTFHSGKTSITFYSSIDNAKQRGTANAFSLIKSPNLNEKGNIKITGYIKTENIKNGTAFIGVQFNGHKGIIAQANTQTKNLTGTTPWTQYSLELPLMSDIQSISFGMMINGTGQAWFDDFKIFIDGREITDTINL